MSGKLLPKHNCNSVSIIVSILFQNLKNLSVFNLQKSAIVAINQAIGHNLKTIHVITDDCCFFRTITSLVKDYKLNGWKMPNGKEVENQVELKHLDELSLKIHIKWVAFLFLYKYIEREIFTHCFFKKFHVGDAGITQAKKLSIDALKI